MVQDKSFFETDAYVNFKTTLNLGPYLAEASARGTPAIVDICDNVFLGPDAGVHEALIDVATRVTAPTEELAGIIRKLGAPVDIIPDCLEGGGTDAPVPPLVGPLKLLWFGRRKNSAPLLDCLPEVAAQLARRTISLAVVCDDAATLVAETMQRAPSLQVHGIEWTPGDLTAALSACHVVLTPTSTDPAFIAKSPNRLAHALWHNRPVVTQPFASLGSIGSFATVGDTIASALQSALDDWPKTVARTQAGRAHVAAILAPEVVARQWDKALRRAADSPPRAPRRDGPRAGVRLNLGCGDKLLPHYINVDLAVVGDDTQPDVVCDVRDLSPFGTGSVDEILTVHVIEHLHQADVPGALAEWLRVLRPGGRLAIECPNLLSACEALLNDPEAASTHDGARAQRTMWAFYGSPVPDKPLMTHRWGYTPASLRKLLTEAGFTDVRSEEPKFKLGAPRDMRVVGFKPL